MTTTEVEEVRTLGVTIHNGSMFAVLFPLKAKYRTRCLDSFDLLEYFARTTQCLVCSHGRFLTGNARFFLESKANTT